MNLEISTDIVRLSIVQALLANARSWEADDIVGLSGADLVSRATELGVPIDHHEKAAILAQGDRIWLHPAPEVDAYQ